MTRTPSHCHIVTPLHSHSTLTRTRTRTHTHSHTQLACTTGDLDATAVRSDLMGKAREVLEVAVLRDPVHWRTHLLLASVLAEMGQVERSEQLLLSCLALQLDSEEGKGGLECTGDLDGYDSDELCPADPMVYGVMCAFFTVQRQPLRARKALRMGSRSWSDGGFQPAVSTHGKPRKTSVLLMSNAALYLLEQGMPGLGGVCVGVAVDCDAAAAAKAGARGLAPDTVPFLRHQLYRAKAKDFMGKLQYQEGTVTHIFTIFLSLLFYLQRLCRPLIPNANTNTNTYPLSPRLASSAMEAARMSVLSIDTSRPQDEVNAWLACAHVQVGAGWPVDELADSYRSAINCARGAVDAGTIPSMSVVPLDAYLSLAKLVLAAGGFQEALKVAVDCCAVYPHASAAYLMAGVCCLRLDRSTDAEDALQVLQRRHSFTILSVIADSHHASPSNTYSLKLSKIPHPNPMFSSSSCGVYRRQTSSTTETLRCGHSCRFCAASWGRAGPRKLTHRCSRPSGSG